MAGSLSGQVTDPRVAAPANPGVPGAQVTATDAANAAFGPVATDGDGKYKIDNLAAGAYTVSVIAPPGFLDPAPVPNINVVDAQDAAVNPIQLAAGSISGRVTNKNDGPPAQQRAVRAIDTKNQPHGPVNTNAQGYYTFPLLAKGKYTVEVLDIPNQASYKPPAHNVEVVDAITVRGIDFSENVVKDFLDRLDDSRFSIESMISKEEANQAVSLFTVVNLMLAGLSRRTVGNEEKIDILGMLNLYYGLQEDSLRAKISVADPTALWSNLESELKELAKDLDQLQSDVDFLSREAKRQFNLGLSNNVLGNTQFPTLFKRYVEIGNDPLLALDIRDADKPGSFVDKTRVAEADDLLKELKSLILQLVRSLSKYGTAATKRVNEDWAEFEARSLEVLSIVARDRVTPDQDEQNVWAVLSDLTNKNRETEVSPYVVLARHGGKLLKLAMDIYLKIENESKLDVFDPTHLRDLFQGGNKGDFLTEKIREQASVIKMHPLANW